MTIARTHAEVYADRCAQASPCDREEAPVREATPLEAVEADHKWLSYVSHGEPFFSELVGPAAGQIIDSILCFAGKLKDGNPNYLASFGVRSAEDVPYIQDVLYRIVAQATGVVISAVVETVEP